MRRWECQPEVTDSHGAFREEESYSQGSLDVLKKNRRLRAAFHSFNIYNIYNNLEVPLIK
jgi:hypothetical protein